MKLKPIYICIIQEHVDGKPKKSELLHEMSDFRLQDLITKRRHSGELYYRRDIRALALNEVDRRQHNSVVNRASAEVEFREEVIAAMMNAGISRRVADSMTIEESKLLNQANKYGVI